MAEYHGIVFDKDGTLIDIQASWVSAGLEVATLMCEHAGSPERVPELLDSAGFDRAQGRLAPDSEWAAGTTESLLEGWAGLLNLRRSLLPSMLDAMCEHAVRNVTPLADLHHVFDRLEALGLTLGVTTMDTEAAAIGCMRRLGVMQRLHFVCGCDSGFGHKPGPGMVEAFCRARSLTAQQVVVVGDTPHDMRMGRAAGAGLVIGVTSGVADREVLAPLADAVADDVSEVPSLLAR